MYCSKHWENRAPSSALCSSAVIHEMRGPCSGTQGWAGTVFIAQLLWLPRLYDDPLALQMFTSAFRNENVITERVEGWTHRLPWWPPLQGCYCCLLAVLSPAFCLCKDPANSERGSEHLEKDNSIVTSAKGLLKMGEWVLLGLSFSGLCVQRCAWTECI